MSTILKALKRLEHEKEAEALRDRVHDPLAPAASAPVAPAGSRRPPVWLAAALAAVLLGAGTSYGLASWWFARDGRIASSDVAAGRTPLAVVPKPERAVAPGGVSSRPLAPVAGIESVQPVTSAPGPTADLAGRIELAQATPADPDPWEQAAAAARAEEEEADTAAADPITRPPVAARPPTVAPTLEGAAQPARGTTAPRATSAAAIPSRRPDPEPSLEGAVPVASLPLIDLPEPRVEPEPVARQVVEEVQAAPKVEARPVARAETKPAPEPNASASGEGLGPVTVQDSDDRVEVTVIRTVWHPKPERRSAQLRLSDRVDPVDVREEDVVEGYVVREITPSSVVLARGKVVVTRRVGR